MIAPKPDFIEEASEDMYALNKSVSYSLVAVI